MADIQVLLVEDDESIRLALRTALRSQPGIEVASEATNGETGLVLLESIDIDVAIVDATLPDMSIVEFVPKMQAVQAESYVQPSKLLVLLAPGQEAEGPALLAAGAQGVCPKDAPIAELADRIRQIHAS
ncbi:response regulator [Trichothermofontia sp.]